MIFTSQNLDEASLALLMKALSPISESLSSPTSSYLASRGLLQARWDLTEIKALHTLLLSSTGACVFLSSSLSFLILDKVCCAKGSTSKAPYSRAVILLASLKVQYFRVRPRRAYIVDLLQLSKETEVLELPKSRQILLALR